MTPRLVCALEFSGSSFHTLLANNSDSNGADFGADIFHIVSSQCIWAVLQVSCFKFTSSNCIVFCLNVFFSKRKTKVNVIEHAVDLHRFCFVITPYAYFPIFSPLFIDQPNVALKTNEYGYIGLTVRMLMMTLVARIYSFLLFIYFLFFFGQAYLFSILAKCFVSYESYKRPKNV